jgi:hypothetical protein
LDTPVKNCVFPTKLKKLKVKRSLPSTSKLGENKTKRQIDEEEESISYYEARQIALKLLANMLVLVPLQEKNLLILTIEFQRL